MHRHTNFFTKLIREFFKIGEFYILFRVEFYKEIFVKHELYIFFHEEKRF